MFYPTYHFRRVYDIPPSLLLEAGIRYIALDVDNTLAENEHPIALKEVLPWLEGLRAAGIHAAILSNNSSARVDSFARSLGLPYICKARKPGKSGFRRCQELWGCKREEMAVIGDQLLTDIWGGCRFKIAAILVDPIKMEDIWFFKWKRWIERIIYAYYRYKGYCDYTQ